MRPKTSMFMKCLDTPQHDIIDTLFSFMLPFLSLPPATCHPVVRCVRVANHMYAACQVKYLNYKQISLMAV